MKLILSSIAILLSLNAFAQTAPTELTRDEKLIAFKAIGSFLPYGEFKGHILGVPKNLLHVHRCVGSVTSVNPEWLSSSLRENKAFPLEAFMDSYHPNPVGITFMSIDDTITHASVSESKVSITALDKKDGSTEMLEVEKTKKNHAIVTVTYVTAEGKVIKNGCDLDLDREFKN